MVTFPQKIPRWPMMFPVGFEIDGVPIPGLVRDYVNPLEDRMVFVNDTGGLINVNPPLDSTGFCLACVRGFCRNCRGDYCKCTHELDTSQTGGSTFSGIILESNNENDSRDELSQVSEPTISDIQGDGFTSSRRNKDDSLVTDPLSTGRKRAAKLYPLDRNANCEWRDANPSNSKGGGPRPVVSGCENKQQARHHGPDKSVMNNTEGNVHRICHHHHVLWHQRNDAQYDANTVTDEVLEQEE